MQSGRRSTTSTDSPKSKAIRIAFLVNNDGLSDSRVVKTAEVMANAGFNCTVIGCAQSSFPRQTVFRNGVRYQILPLKRSSFVSAICALSPRAYSRLMSAAVRLVKRRPNQDIRGSSTSENSEPRSATLIDTSPPTIISRTAVELAEAERSATPQSSSREDHRIPPRLSLLKRVARTTILFTRWMLRSPRRRWLETRRMFVGTLQPRNSTLGVRVLFGRYLRTFLPALLTARPFEVVYCHELWTLESGALSILDDAHAVLVYDSHELEQHRNNDWSETSNRLRTDYEKKYICRADMAITVCQSIAEYLHQSYGISTPLVVPNAPLAATLRSLSPDNKLKRSLGLSTQKLIVYTGKVTTGRGLNLVVSSLKPLRHVHLAIVGPRVAAVTEDILKLAQRTGTAERIHFVDAVPPEYLVSLISDADLAVVPIENICLSYYYSLPNKIYEATMAGLPVLASDFPELRRFVRKHRVGRTVDFTDMSAVRTSVSEMLMEDSSYNDSSKAESLRQMLSFDQALQPVIDALTRAHSCSRSHE